MATSHPLTITLTAVLADAASVLDIPAEDIDVLEVTSIEWPDSCLGVPGTDEMCAEVITPGYRITLAGGLIYHTDRQGNFRQARCHPDDETTIRLSYLVIGGVGGWSTSFETDSSRLTEAEDKELRRLIADADFFNVPNVEPTTVIMDGFTGRLKIAVGRRHHEVVRGDGIEYEDTAEFLALRQWAQDRTPPLHGRPFTRIED